LDAGELRVRFDGAGAGTVQSELVNTVGTHTFFLTSTGQDEFDVRATATFDGDVDNVILSVAIPDHSINDNGLGVTGLVTRVPFGAMKTNGACLDDRGSLLHGLTDGVLDGYVRYGAGRWFYFNGVESLRYASGETLEGARENTPDYPTCYAQLSYKQE